MRENTRTTGKQYEEAAKAFLQGQGYVILEENFRCPYGEIDLIAREGDCIAFVEVKYRAGDRAGGPLEAVGPKKMQRLSRTAGWYFHARRYQEIPACRFDVVGISGEEIQLVRNAFEYVGR